MLLHSHKLFFDSVYSGTSFHQFFKNYLIIYFWLPWVFVAECGLSLIVVSRGYSMDFLSFETSLAVQWLRLQPPNAEGPGLPLVGEVRSCWLHSGQKQNNVCVSFS